MRTPIQRVARPRNRFLQVVAGARQVGKTTLVQHVLDRLDVPSVFVFADEPTVGDTAWLSSQWDRVAGIWRSPALFASAQGSAKLAEARD